MAATEDLIEFDRVDDYVIDRVLGRGTSAVTYLVSKGEGTDRKLFALKRLDAEGGDAGMKMSNEVSVLKRLDGNGVPRFVSEGTTNGRPYVVMTVARGRTIWEEITELARDGNKLNPERVVAILEALLDALCGIHQQGLVHRDIKAANVFVADSNVVTIVDFGNTKPAGENSPRTDDSFWKGGAAVYAPISKLERPASAESAHDVFAVGVMGYLLLTSALPWSKGPSDDRGTLAERMRTEQPRAIRSITQRVTPELQTFISSLIVQDDSKRPNANEALSALRSLRAAWDPPRTTERIQYPHVTRDPIYGDIRLTSIEWAVIDTIEMQRLRWIKQLGFTNFVYISAEHSRLSHVVGCVQRVEDILRSVEDTSGHPIDNETRERARLFALIHDVTHIAYGHTLEDELGHFRRHDENELRIQRLLMNSSEEPRSLSNVLGKSAVGRDVLSMMDPQATKVRKELFVDLVAGHTGADVLDYINRDAYFCGLDERIDSAIFRQFKLVDASNSNRGLVSEGYGSKGIRIDRELAVEGLLRLRYAMFLKVYTHPVKNAASAMLDKAMSEVKNKKRFKESDIEFLGDNALLDSLARGGSTEPAKRLGSMLLSRELFVPCFRAKVLPEPTRMAYDSMSSEMKDFHGFDLTAPDGRRQFEKQIAATVKGVRDLDVALYLPARAPGLQKIVHSIQRQPADAPIKLGAADGPFADIQRRHLELWEAWLYVSPTLTASQKESLGHAAAERLGLKNVIGTGWRQTRLF